MNSIFPIAGLEAGVIAVLAVTALVAGLARGFSGFGAGLIIMPVASSLIGPVLAAGVFAIADFVLAMPLLPNAVRKCEWPTVLPAALAALIFVPLGAMILVAVDPLTVRWNICVIILLMLMLLMSGWRYQGRPHMSASIGVGAVAGVLSGAAQVPGPPIVTYWMSGPANPATIRANLIVFFVFTSVGALSAYFVNGILSGHAWIVAAIVGPGYGVGIWAGARLHAFAPEWLFRRIVFGLIALAAVSSVPALDGLLRPD